MDSIPYCTHQFSRPSNHALVRMRQRSIPHEVVGYLLDFAKAVPAGQRAERHLFDRSSWQHLAAFLGGRTKEIERYRNTFAIVANGVVVTVGWRH